MPGKEQRVLGETLRHERGTGASISQLARKYDLSTDRIYSLLARLKDDDRLLLEMRDWNGSIEARPVAHLDLSMMTLRLLRALDIDTIGPLVDYIHREGAAERLGSVRHRRILQCLGLPAARAAPVVPATLGPVDSRPTDALGIRRVTEPLARTNGIVTIGQLRAFLTQPDDRLLLISYMGPLRLAALRRALADYLVDAKDADLST